MKVDLRCLGRVEVVGTVIYFTMNHAYQNIFINLRTVGIMPLSVLSIDTSDDLVVNLTAAVLKLDGNFTSGVDRGVGSGAFHAKSQSSKSGSDKSTNHFNLRVYWTANA